MARMPEICKGYSEEEIEAFKELQKIFSERLGYAYCRCEMHPIKEKVKMEFDKSKILTCVTAFQATVGMSGWFSDNLMDLEEQIKSNSPKGVISEIYTMRAPNRFVDEDTTAWNLFYPAPEPTYAKRQAEWVKANNVKVGTKVRFTKDFDAESDGSSCCEHRDAKGREGFVNEIFDTYISVVVYGDYWVVPFTALEIIKEPTYEERQEEWIKKHNLKEGDKVKILRTAKDRENGWGNIWAEAMSSGVGSVFTYVGEYPSGIRLSCGYNWPYFVLEVIKEPTYRPFKNAEEFKPYREKWIIFHETIFQHDGYNNDGINIENELFPWGKAFGRYKFEDGTPFGIKEEA